MLLKKDVPTAPVDAGDNVIPVLQIKHPAMDIRLGHLHHQFGW
jgi:hypothetical protein